MADRHLGLTVTPLPAREALATTLARASGAGAEWACGHRSRLAAPAARQGPGGRAVLRAAHRVRPGRRRQAVARPLQPAVQGDVRRIAPPVPADPAAGAGRRPPPPAPLAPLPPPPLGRRARRA